jgi:hypothetical protein
MAAPLKTGKRSVNMAGGARVSRIRRDPPPVVKKVEVADPEERETRMVIVGVVGFAVALAIVMVAISSAAGWSPSEYTIHLKDL